MKKKNNIKINSGFYKGSCVQIKKNCNVRPTSSRLKNILFNFIQNEIKKSVCLDLFGGSGALSIEAISRGAKKLILVEKNSIIIDKLKSNVNRLNIKNIVVYNMDALYYLSHTKQKFNIIFLDPPYKLNILNKTIKIILHKNLLSNGGFIYIELNNIYFFYKKFPKISIYNIQKVGGTFFCLLQNRF